MRTNKLLMMLALGACCSAGAAEPLAPAAFLKTRSEENGPLRAVRERGMDEPLRAIEWGPLVFAQPFKETWTPVKDDPKSRPLPPEWPWYDVTCAEKPTLYALPVKTAFDPSSIRVKRVATDAYPWETPPVRLVVPMVRAPQAYAAEPERRQKNTAPIANPVAVGRDAAREDVELVPFGATCLRLACFPLAN